MPALGKPGSIPGGIFHLHGPKRNWFFPRRTLGEWWSGSGTENQETVSLSVPEVWLLWVKNQSQYPCVCRVLFPCFYSKWLVKFCFKVDSSIHFHLCFLHSPPKSRLHFVFFWSKWPWGNWIGAGCFERKQGLFYVNPRSSLEIPRNPAEVPKTASDSKIFRIEKTGNKASIQEFLFSCAFYK